MKPIENIDINEAFKLAEEDVRQAKVRLVSSAIKDLLIKLTNSEIKAARLKQDLEKQEKESGRLKECIEKIKSGDWSAVPELKEEKPVQEVADNIKQHQKGIYE